MARGRTGGRALALGLAALIAATPAQAGPLEERRPILRFDTSERPSGAVYGRALAGTDGRRWLQYWIYYDYNSQDRGLFRTGRHEGDWEFAQVGLGRGGRPERVTLAQHSWAEGCDWSEVERSGAAPVLYVANGSHATYAAAGTVDRPWPDPNDEADGKGARVRPDALPFGDWVRYRGRYGRSEAGWVPGEQSSPPGPPFQEDGRWQDPAGYDRAARACGSGAPSRPWQTALMVALLAAGMLLVVRRIARR